MNICPVAMLQPCPFSRCALIRVVVAIGVVAVYWLKRAGSWVRGQLISLMSQLPAAYDDGVAPTRCGPAELKRHRIAGKRNAEAFASTSPGQASRPSVAEAYVSASTGQASSSSAAEAYVSASSSSVAEASGMP